MTRLTIAPRSAWASVSRAVLSASASTAADSCAHVNNHLPHHSMRRAAASTHCLQRLRHSRGRPIQRLTTCFTPSQGTTLRRSSGTHRCSGRHQTATAAAAVARPARAATATATATTTSPAASDVAHGDPQPLHVKRPTAATGRSEVIIALAALVRIRVVTLTITINDCAHSAATAVYVAAGHAVCGWCRAVPTRRHVRRCARRRCSCSHGTPNGRRRRRGRIRCLGRHRGARRGACTRDIADSCVRVRSTTHTARHNQPHLKHERAAGGSPDDQPVQLLDAASRRACARVPRKAPLRQAAHATPTHPSPRTPARPHTRDTCTAR